MKIILVVVVVALVGYGCPFVPPEKPEWCLENDCPSSFICQNYWETTIPTEIIKGGLPIFVAKYPQYRDDVRQGLEILIATFEDPTLAAVKLGEVLYVKVDWLNQHIPSDWAQGVFSVARGLAPMFQSELPISDCDREWSVAKLREMLSLI